MSEKMIISNESIPEMWDAYVKYHPDASVYHQSFFNCTVESTYKHKPYYLTALNAEDKIEGVLPLFFVNSFLFGKSLVSLPFCDYGGILADNTSIGLQLLQKGIDIAKSLKCKSLELRQTTEHSYFPVDKGLLSVNKAKVRMRLDLPESADLLFSSFSAKLRSQIRKPQKEGCTAKNGGVELLDDFYNVFVYNMRDLGSPVHTKSLMKRMIEKDPHHTRLFVIYLDKTPVACSLVSGFNSTLVNPWASFKRNYQKIAPNMLLYWEMLCFAINQGYKIFDFGRSTPNEGTYKFKEQWGAKPEQLFWYSYHLDGKGDPDDSTSDKKDKFIRIWRKLPIGITRFFGPILRRHIHL